MQNEKTRNPIQNIEQTVKHINDISGEKTRTAFKKYPVIFSLLVTIGFVSLLQGFELVLSKIIFIQNNPSTLIVFGLLILIFTGSLYKIIDKK